MRVIRQNFQNFVYNEMSNLMQFWGYCRFIQIRPRIFNCTDMKLVYFILDKILKLDVLHAFLSLIVAKLSQKQSDFLAHPVENM